ncbi:hybrid sensor histidine kinase/response regulator [Spirochaeta africana]|nr:hybrid sensor histidine kinase/response regulator [Spirochaeta africana]
MMRILLVEDSRMFSRLVERTLTARLEVQIDTAASLVETRELVARQSYDVALLDLVLPDAHDGEVVDYVVGEGIPVIAFTGRFDESHREQILAKNVVDYVIKNSLNSAYQLADIVERLQRNDGIRILVVDDSATMRANICKILHAYRFQTIDASNGRVAAELLDEHPDINLVIADYNMPQMDGYELLEKIRQKRSRADLPFIGVSGSDNPLLSARFLKLGANDFLAKPFSREELYSRVLNCIEMLEYVEQLRQLDKQKNSFLGMAAHDLRNPINSISGFSGLLLDMSAERMNSQEQEFLELIHQSADEMLSIVNDLLDINAIQTGKLEIKRSRGSLGAAVAGRVRLFDSMAQQKQITLHYRQELDDEILFDRMRVCQVLDNLISNAIKYSPPGSEIRMVLVGDESEARISISDQGPGISAEEQEKLFRPFSRGAARPTGGEASTGLGLAISKRIIEAHSGSILLESEPGQGSTFTVVLPVN